MKLKNFWDNIPRPVKACALAVLVILVGGMYYIALGCPTLLMRQEFRRAERVNLVGPSKIVATVKDYGDFQKMIVGETEHGICFLGKYGESIQGGKHKGQKNYLFTYREKTGDITLAAAPNVFGRHWMLSGENLPVYVFTSYEDAVTTKIDFLVSGAYRLIENGVDVTKSFTESFHTEGSRGKNAFFSLRLDCDDEYSGRAMHLISTLFSGNVELGSTYESYTVTATVTLLDSDGQLVAEETITLQR